VGNFIDSYNTYADIPRWLSITIYLWQAHKYLSAYKTKHASLNGRTNNYKWLQLFTRVFLVFQGIWFVYLVPYIIPRYTNTMLDTFDWYPVYIPLAIMIYWLGIKGYIISQQEFAINKKNANPVLPADIVQQTISILKNSMEEDNLFLNPNLNLNLLSENTGVTQKIISAVLNQHMHKSFNEFINEYRVAAFKEKIVQPSVEQLTIAGVAFECGFSSQATFQRTFKQITGMSPSEFRNTTMQIQ
jgi:AraC-like DNA-binding protein